MDGREDGMSGPQTFWSMDHFMGMLTKKEVSLELVEIIAWHLVRHQ